MQSKFIFNRGKTETIILFHGLYANAGFWLKYLKMFKDFKVIIYNINYTELASKNAARLSLLRSLIDHCKIDEVSALVTHSFGTIFPDKLVRILNTRIFKICPVAYSKRKNMNKFICDIHDLTKQSYEEIRVIMQMSKVVIPKFGVDSNLGIFYIPSNDEYFVYATEIHNSITYQGSHFEILEAIKDIIDKINDNNIV